MVDDGPVHPGEQGAHAPRFRVVPADDPAEPSPPDPAPEVYLAEHAERLIPRSVKAALGVVGLEILALLLVQAFLVSTVVQDVTPNTRMTWATMVFAALLCLGLLAGGFAVLRGRRWGRAPLVTYQVLQLVSAAPALASSSWGVGGVLVALSAFGLVSLLSPGVTRHLTWREIPSSSRFF